VVWMVEHSCLILCRGRAATVKIARRHRASHDAKTAQ
jgi:hypothetical protein